MNMSISPTSSPFADYSGPPPVLVAASSDTAHSRAAATIEAAGFRVASTSIAGAVDRMALQASASALWVEVDDDAGPVLDRLLDRIDAEAGMGRFPAIVAAPVALIDPITARLVDSRTDLLVDPSPAERVSALALAAARRGPDGRLHDIASEHSAERLRQLSDEVGRIAATLARLSSGPSTAPIERPRPSGDGDLAIVSGEVVRQVIRARRLRARYFEEELFADPAWDMLLDLLQAEIAQHRVPVSSLCIAAAVPATTALRWIKTMTDNGLFVRRSDPHDGRRVFVELAPAASAALHRYFGDISKAAVV